MCVICTSLRPWTPDCDYGDRAPAGGGTRATLVESTDAPAGTGTPYVLAPGDTFNGSYRTNTDIDWVRVNLTAGSTYAFALASSAADTYLSLRSPAGVTVAANDDANGTNSRINYTATTTGTYYLLVDQYENVFDDGTGSTGSYVLSVQTATPPPVWTPAQMADQLTDGYWDYSGGGPRRFDIDLGDQISVNLTGLTSTMASLARQALQAWTDTTGLRFVETGAQARIEFSADPGDSGPDAYATSVTNQGIIDFSTVTIDQDWLNSQGSTLFSYTFQTYLHEIGHALGLGHAGDYNGSASYGTDNSALNESWQISVMSYFDQAENTYIADTYAYVFTPMLADILAIAQLYGTPATLRTGDTVYGNNSNAGGNYALFAATNSDANESVTIAVTVVDNGGTDTFDFRQDGFNQRIDLREATVSDVYGDLGTLGIALGTVIENALAGRGNDTVTGNDRANRIEGNDGNDLLAGNEGADSLFGGKGQDTLNGGTGDDILLGGTTADDLRDVVYGGDGQDSIDGGAGNDELNGGNGNDTVSGGLGADTLVGNGGNDVLAGAGGADLIYGNDGNDFLNGGFGSDRLNGGAGADSFFHQGVVDHGADWVQDYSAAEGDMLACGLAGATAAQFQVNLGHTAGAGSAGVAEAFVIWRPTGQILWALVDGGDEVQINLSLGGQMFGLLA